MIEVMRHVFSFLFGLVFVGGLLAFIYKRHAEEWERLVAIYGRAWTAPLAKKARRSLVLYREGSPARTYAGIVTVGVYPDGIGLKPIRCLAPFHAPVFIPFSDIKGWKQSWYWDGASTELMFARAPELQMIMPETQVKWISSIGSAGVTLSEDYVPRANWPHATQAMAVMSLCMVITLIAILLLKHFAPGVIFPVS